MVINSEGLFGQFCPPTADVRPTPQVTVLRSYQVECVEAVLNAIATRRSVIFTSATGTGKTTIFCRIAEIALERNPGKKVLILAHRKELIEQAAERIRRVTGVHPEIEMAQHWASSVGRVVVSSIQTQISGMGGKGRMSRFDPKDFCLVVMDEAHRSVSVSWMEVQRYYLDGNPELKCVLCTATPDRGDGRALAQVAEYCAYRYPLTMAIDDGWLCGPRWKPIDVAELDYSNVQTSGGDLNQKQVGEILERDSMVVRMTGPILQQCAGKQTLVFAASVKQSIQMADAINAVQPASAIVVHGETANDQRKQAFADFAARRRQYLLNVGIVTEGTDLPGVEVVALCRPTKSRGLYEQMIGRGVRPLIGDVLSRIADSAERRAAIAASPKPFFTVIDFEGNAGRHSLVSLPDVLAGDMTPPQKARLKAKAKANLKAGDQATDVREAITQLAIDDERNLTAERRAVITAHVGRVSKAANPWELYGLTPPKLDERYRNIPKRVPQKIVLALVERGIDCAKMRDVDVWKAWRKLGDKPTLEQVKHLARLGYDPQEAASFSRDRVEDILRNQSVFLS
jgi:superfamily II DNA or RNA helicase